MPNAGRMGSARSGSNEDKPPKDKPKDKQKQFRFLSHALLWWGMFFSLAALATLFLLWSNKYQWPPNWLEPIWSVYSSHQVLFTGIANALNIGLAVSFMFSLRWRQGKLQWARGMEQSRIDFPDGAIKNISTGLGVLTQMIGASSANSVSLSASYVLWLVIVAVDTTWFSVSTYTYLDAVSKATAPNMINIWYALSVVFAWAALAATLLFGLVAYGIIYRHLQRPWDFRAYEVKRRLPKSWRWAVDAVLKERTEDARKWIREEELENVGISPLGTEVAASPLTESNADSGALRERLRTYYDKNKWDWSAVLAERVGMTVRWFGLLPSYQQRHPHRYRPSKHWLRDARAVISAVFYANNKPQPNDPPPKNLDWLAHYSGPDTLLIANALEYGHCPYSLRSKGDQCLHREYHEAAPYCCRCCLDANPCGQKRKHTKSCEEDPGSESLSANREFFGSSVASYFLCEFLRQCKETPYTGALLLISLLAPEGDSRVRNEKMAFTLWLMTALYNIEAIKNMEMNPQYSILVPLSETETELDLPTVLNYYFWLRFRSWLLDYTNSSTLYDDCAHWKHDVGWMAKYLKIPQWKFHIRKFPFECFGLDQGDSKQLRQALRKLILPNEEELLEALRESFSQCNTEGGSVT